MIKDCSVQFSQIIWGFRTSHAEPTSGFEPRHVSFLARIPLDILQK